MKKLLLSMFAVVASVVAMAQGSDDFSTLDSNNSYKSGASSGGWAFENAAIQNKGNSDIFGEATAVCINGKTSTVGKITSPVIMGGIGTLTLNYAYIFNESKGVSFKVSILKGETEVFSQDVVNTELAKSTVATETIELNNSDNGLQIVITNNSPSNSTGNKDRYSIWNISWTGCGGDAIYVPSPKVSVANGTYYEPQTVTLSAVNEGNTVYYYFEGEESKAYTEPISLTETGTYVLFTYAEDAEGNKSDVISRTITIAEAVTYTSLADIRTACTAASESEAPVVKLSVEGLTATYASSSSSYTFVSDGTNAFLIYGSQRKIATGNKLKGYILGKLYIYNGTHELAFIDNMDNVTIDSEAGSVAPVEITSLDDFNYEKDESKIFLLKNMTLADTELASYQLKAYDGETNEATLYDRWGVLSAASLNTVDKFDITAIATKYKDAEVFYVTNIEKKTNDYVPYQPVGDGSRENPYTVEDVIELYKSNTHPKDPVWAHGYILGCVESNSGKTLLADDENVVPTNLSVGTADGEKHISVQLLTEDKAPGIRSTLNVKDNPQNVGKEVYLYGTIDKYCSIPGVKSVSDFELISGPETLINEITKLIEKYREDGSVTIEEIKTLINKYVK